MYYRLFNVKEQKVMIKSELSHRVYNKVEFPVRIFTALTRRHRPMGSLCVMPGCFQEVDYQYCLAYSLFVDPIYRQRHLAERLMRRCVGFVEKEKFNSLICIIRSNNYRSINLMSKIGFEFVPEDELTRWEIKEASLFDEPVLVARYNTIKIG